MLRVGLTLMASLSLTAPAAAALPSPAETDRLAHQAMQATGAKGLAIALIDNGRVQSVQSFGVRNGRGDALTPDTIMYGASLTKSVFAYLVMQLADEGRVSLDRPINEVLGKPIASFGNLDAYGNWGDLAGDPRVDAITPRMVLTHSTGFANFAFVEPDGKLRIHFQPGTRYGYSGEGIMLLQFMVDRGLGLDTGAELQRRIFDPLGMRRTSLKWRPDFADNLADGWKVDGTIEPHDERSRVRAAGSMDTTITDMAAFGAAMVRGWRLSRASRLALATQQMPIRTRAQFGSGFEPAPIAQQAKGIGAGLGVITFSGPQGRGFFKGGHNDSTANTLVCVERRRRCILIMSNDVRAEAAFPALVRSILGETGVPYGWEYPNLEPVKLK